MMGDFRKIGVFPVYFVSQDRTQHWESTLEFIPQIGVGYTIMDEFKKIILEGVAHTIHCVIDEKTGSSRYTVWLTNH